MAEKRQDALNVSDNGWCGKILRVDLSSEIVTELDTQPYADRFLGGRGIATRLYWEHVPADAGAFDSKNHLIFMTGSLTATGAQGASRFEVVGKSPMLMPEGFCYGNMGGYWGPALKRAGFDGLIVSGKANRSVYLFISNGKARLEDATAIYLEGVTRVGKYLKEKHGSKTHFIATGPAGMNLCRNANLMTDNEGSATGGFGAVFGSKNLKAIAVVGIQAPTVSNPEALKELNHLTIALNKRDTSYNPYPPDQISRKGKASCFQCGLDCTMRSTYRTKSNKEVVRKCQAMFVYFPWVMNLQYPGSTPVSSDAYRKATAKFWGHEKAWDLNTYEGKAMAATHIMDRTYVKDSLGLCDSCWPLMFSHHTEDKVGDTTLEARTFNAVTGNNIDEIGLLKFGERIFNQQRAILLQEGWNPEKDDMVQEFNFTDPVQSVFMNPDVLVPGEGDTVLNRKGQTLDREVFMKMRDEFYQLRGWNPETGYPLAEKFTELGLSDVLDAKPGLVHEK